MDRTGLPDRTVRELIAQARRNHPIINFQDGTGYYLPTRKSKYCWPPQGNFTEQEVYFGQLKVAEIG